MRKKIWILVGSIFIFSLNLAGCAGTFKNDSDQSSISLVDMKVKNGVYLNEARVGSRVEFPHSPWGEKVSIEINDIYVAATQRECMKIVIFKSKPETKQSALLCKVSGNVWEPVRFFAG